MENLIDMIRAVHAPISTFVALLEVLAKLFFENRF